MVLHADEDVHNELVGDVVEALVEIAHTALRVLFENLELGVLLVQFVSNGAADDVSEHRLEGLFVAVVVLNGHEARRLALLLALAVGLLAHDTDRLIGRLHSHWLDFTNGDAVNHCSLLLLCSFALDHRFMGLDLFGGEVAGAASVCEAFVHALSFAHGLVRRHDVLGSELLRGLVRDPLQLLVLHLACDGLLGVSGHRLFFIFEQLLLD
mmetsp:Transcript_35903/g.47233  ORF Transcript_35903/g.47233 Transcript_35903/m.47233 type:complete len:210 (-) Transcript_35903:388-1017(-)